MAGGRGREFSSTRDNNMALFFAHMTRITQQQNCVRLSFAADLFAKVKRRLYFGLLGKTDSYLLDEMERGVFHHAIRRASELRGVERVSVLVVASPFGTVASSCQAFSADSVKRLKDLIMKNTCLLFDMLRIFILI
jgi:hypothetical protein